MEDDKLKLFLVTVCVLMFMFSMIVVAYKTGKAENPPPETVEAFELGRLTVNMAIVMLLGMVYVALEGKDVKYAVMLAVGEVLLLVTMLILSQLAILG